MKSGLDISEERRRKKERVTIAFAVLLVVMLGLVEYRLMAGRSSLPASGNILIFAIINLNILLILLIIYLTTRNIVKLVFEDRARLFGAKLRTKLVTAFVFMSLIPTAVLFFVSMQFLDTSLKLWFDERIEQSLEGAILIGRTYYDDKETWLKEVGVGLAEDLTFKCLSEGKALDTNCTKDWLEVPATVWANSSLKAATDLDVIKVLDPEGTPIFSKKALGLIDQVPPVPKEILKRVYSGESLELFSTDLETGELLEAVILLKGAQDDAGKGVLVVGYLMPQKVSNLLSSIKNGYEEYQTFKLYKKPLRSTVLITLFLITLLIIFIAVWFGFRLARHITEPIQALAEATYRIAQGDLDFSLKPKGKDELNALVQAFNTMTQDLKEAKKRAENASMQLRRSYMELEQRRRYIEVILQNVAAGVISIDRMGIVRTMNRSAELILDLKADMIVGKHYSELLTPIQAEEFDTIRQEISASSKGVIQRPMRVKVGEREISLIVTFSVLRDQEGRSLGVVVVFDDLTELEKIQRMAAWREVARRIAHEVKNPLTPIQLSAQRLQRKYGSRLTGKEKAVFERCTQTIVTQVDELKRLVNEFSSFARMPSIRPRKTDLKRLSEEVTFMYKENYPQCTFKVRAEGKELKEAEVDPDQIKRALINLVDNAVHAMPEGGELIINLSYSRENDEIRIEVLDTGKGIPKKDRSRLFEPYFSRKKGGTGLGLAIVNSIVADHGGSISVEENIPSGTRFIIRLPGKISRDRNEKDNIGS